MAGSNTAGLQQQHKHLWLVTGAGPDIVGRLAAPAVLGMIGAPGLQPRSWESIWINSYKRHRSRPGIISYAAWLYKNSIPAIETLDISWLNAVSTSLGSRSAWVRRVVV